MLKKYIVLIIIFIVSLLINTNVFAEKSLSIDVDYNDNVVYIMGNGFTYSDDVLVIVEDPESAINYIGTSKLADGTFDLSYKLENPKDGIYKVQIKLEDEPIASGEFFYKEFSDVKSYQLFNKENQEFTVLFSKKINGFEQKEFYINYDTESLELIGINLEEGSDFNLFNLFNKLVLKSRNISGEEKDCFIELKFKALKDGSSLIKIME